MNIEQDMLEFLNNNKSTIEELVGKEITEDMIKDATDQLETKDLSNSYKQTIINARSNMSDSEKMVLKGYSILISNNLRIIVFILIILDLLLIALIQKSVYKWIKILGASLLISGIGSIIISFVVKIIVKSLASIDSFNIFVQHITLIYMSFAEDPINNIIGIISHINVSLKRRNQASLIFRRLHNHGMKSIIMT